MGESRCFVLMATELEDEDVGERTLWNVLGSKAELRTFPLAVARDMASLIPVIRRARLDGRFSALEVVSADLVDDGRTEGAGS